MIRIVGLLAIAVTALGSECSAQTLSVCRGEYQGECQRRYSVPLDYTLFIGCGDPDDVAKKTCNVQGGSAPRYRVILRKSQSGNRCGYNIYDIYCYNSFLGGFGVVRPSEATVDYGKGFKRRRPMDYTVGGGSN
jgi:hypothetical protein